MILFDVTIPPEQRDKNLTKKLIAENAGILNWRLHTKVLYETYIKWCNKNNERVMSQKWLGLRMSEKGFKRLSTNGQRVWLGLSVKVEWRGIVK